MTLFYILAGICALIAIAAGLDMWRRRDWPILTRATPKTSQTFTPTESYYLRDVNPPSFSTPAAKGIAPDARRASDHQATVVQFIHKRQTRSH